MLDEKIDAEHLEQMIDSEKLLFDDLTVFSDNQGAEMLLDSEGSQAVSYNLSRGL